jgi:NTP pyrophosphatase (non-canonical NTP hydrolase)
MLNRQQLLLVKLAEEASEVAQIALKTVQFGAHETCPGLLQDNFERVNAELQDLFAVVQILNDEFDLGFVSDETLVKLKTLKINKYAQYSRDLGLVE